MGFAASTCAATALDRSDMAAPQAPAGSGRRRRGTTARNAAPAGLHGTRPIWGGARRICADVPDFDKTLRARDEARGAPPATQQRPGRDRP